MIRRPLARSAVLLAALAAGAVIMPASAASAARAASSPATPSLDQTLAQANKLSDQIQELSQQYDSLQIQLTQAKDEAALAREDARRDRGAYGQDQSSLAAIAVEDYVTGGVSPTLQLMLAGSPQGMLDRASILAQIQREDGAKVNLVARAETAATRAQAAAAQQEQKAALLTKQMKAKEASIQQKENFFNSQAFAQAAAIYQQTGHYPDIKPTGDSIGVQALRYALTKVGDPYVWGAAGPNSFDCSGLVLWAYAQVGISLLHYTGDQWNEGEHISKDQLEPGDLVFFFSDLSHVGMYVGNGLMIDASTFGVPVHVEPVFWNVYQGAVRIVG